MSATAEHLLTLQEDNLPPGWSLATIEDLVGKGGVFIDGDWVESKDQDPEGDVRLIQLADVGDGEYRDKSARFLTNKKAVELGCTFLKKGDVLIARMPDPLGRACIFPGDSKPAVTVVDVAIVRSANGEFNHRWLMYFVNAPAFRAAVASMQSGSTRKRISRGNLSKITFPVPPLDQQKRIVAEIEKQFSRLDEAVANLKRVKVNLKRYKAAVLKAAVEGRLVETEAELARRAAQGSANVAGGRMPGATEGRSYETGAQLLQRILETRRSQQKGKGKYKEPAAPDTTDLPELPEGWVWASTEQLGHIQLGRQRSPKNRSKDNPVKYIRAANITERGLELEDMLDMEFSPDEQDRYRLRRGDLVLSEASGSPDQVGKPAVWQDQLPLCCFQNTVIRLRPAMDMSLYLLTCFQTYYINGVFSKVAGGVGINHLSADKFSRIHVSLPPLTEQYRIVAEVDRRLSLIRETETQIDANFRRAERLRQSILGKAFAGQLAQQYGINVYTESATSG